MLIPNHDDFDIGTFTVVHKSNRSHIDRVGTNATLLHKAPTQDDGEVAIFSQHDGAWYGLASDLNGPFAEVGDSVETVRSRSGIFGDESVVESKATADVDVTVATLQHHGNILDGTDATFEQTNAELRVEFLEGNLVRRSRRGGGLGGFARLCGVGRDGVVVGCFGSGKLGDGRLAVTGSRGGLARRGVHDRVTSTGGHSSCFAVVIGGRDVRSGNTVDADSAALATTRGAVDEGRLVNNGDVGTVLVCAINRVVVIRLLVGDFRGLEVDCRNEL